MTSTELVGPLPTVVFHGGYELRGNAAHKDPGVKVVVDKLPPKNTLDPRYPTCADHRTACICREAILNEDIAEYRGLWNGAREAVREVLADHRTFPDSYAKRFVRWGNDQQIWEYELDDSACCSCTGCQIARKAWLR